MKYLKRFNESNKEQMEKIYKSKFYIHFGKSLDTLNKQNNVVSEDSLESGESDYIITLVDSIS